MLKKYKRQFIEVKLPTILYHNTSKKNLNKILREGLKTDYNGFIYLMEKPISFDDILLKVIVPNKKFLVDWKDVWMENGEEIDLDHQYDYNNPYWIYMSPIPAKYLEVISIKQ